MTYNTKITDLSEDRQKDYYDTLVRLGKTQEWGETALTINDKDNWEMYGFGCFSLGWFEARVNKLMKKDTPILTPDVLYAEIKRVEKKLDEFIRLMMEREEDGE